MELRDSGATSSLTDVCPWLTHMHSNRTLIYTGYNMFSASKWLQSLMMWKLLVAGHPCQKYTFKMSWIGGTVPQPQLNLSNGLILWQKTEKLHWCVITPMQQWHKNPLSKKHWWSDSKKNITIKHRCLNKMEKYFSVLTTCRLLVTLLLLSQNSWKVWGFPGL